MQSYDAGELFYIINQNEECECDQQNIPLLFNGYVVEKRLDELNNQCGEEKYIKLKVSDESKGFIGNIYCDTPTP